MRSIILLIVLSFLAACSEYNITEQKGEEPTASTDVPSDIPADEPETDDTDAEGDTDAESMVTDDDVCVPTGDEFCDGIDNNCDGNIDEGSASDATVWYADADTDEYGDPDNNVVACAPPLGYVADNTDCDDTNARNHPDALEYCDFEDNDCDELIEYNDPSAAWEISYHDGDGDGFGGETAGQHCSIYGDMPVDHARTRDDCNDDDPNVYPGNGC